MGLVLLQALYYFDALILVVISGKNNISRAKTVSTYAIHVYFHE